MQIPTGVALAGALQLLLLIASVYAGVSFVLDDGARFSAADMLVITLQAANLVWLRQFMLAYAGGALPDRGRTGRMLFAQGVIMLLLLARFLRRAGKVRAMRQKLLMSQSIRETIDQLPGGICFSTPEGRPVLVNRKMNELLFQLTGHTIMNAEATWEELLRLRARNEGIKADEPWITQKHIGEVSDDCIFFSFSGGRIWRFRKEYLTEKKPHYIQLQATEISDLYWYSKRLYENNQKLAVQYERQKSLLSNIVEINHEKEILQAKMRIHDDLGRSIIITKQHLENRTLDANLQFLAEIWRNAIGSMEDFTYMNPDADISPEIELKRASDMIGCKINIQGERPLGRKASLLFYSVVREALTNAVMHAKANQLNVIINPIMQGYRVEIGDNGNVAVAAVTEGSGLSNLRNRLEQEGATLEIRCENGVTLVAEIPAEK